MQSNAAPTSRKGECRGNVATNHFPVQTPLNQFNSLIGFPYGLAREVPLLFFFFFIFISALLGLTTYGLNCSKFSSVAIISTRDSFLTSTPKFYSADSVVIICMFGCIYQESPSHMRFRKTDPFSYVLAKHAISVSVTPQTAEDCSVAQHCHKPAPHLA